MKFQIEQPNFRRGPQTWDNISLCDLEEPNSMLDHLISNVRLHLGKHLFVVTAYSDDEKTDEFINNQLFNFKKSDANDRMRLVEFGSDLAAINHPETHLCDLETQEGLNFLKIMMADIVYLPCVDLREKLIIETVADRASLIIFGNNNNEIYENLMASVPIDVPAFVNDRQREFSTISHTIDVVPENKFTIGH